MASDGTKVVEKKLEALHAATDAWVKDILAALPSVVLALATLVTGWCVINC